MIKLKEWELDLLRRIEEANNTDYGITTIDGEDYIKTDDLMVLVDETQDYRDYAERQVFELEQNINKEDFNDIFDKYYRAEGSLSRANKKIKELTDINKRLKEEIERTFNEDDWDRLYEEGLDFELIREDSND